MLSEVRERDGVRFVEAMEVVAVDDALEIVSACAAADTDRLLLDASNLPEEFFDLSTTFAGHFIQKLQNYRIRTAAVFWTTDDYSEPMQEFIREAKTSNDFRTFSTRDQAEAWLASDA